MSAPHDMDAVRAQARAWIDGVNSGTGPSGGWRLQILRLRTRRKFEGASAGPVTDANGDAVSSVGAASPDGGCDELPARIRRFVSGCPWALVDQAIRYLHEIAPYTGIIYNGVKSDRPYRPTMTQWLRDDESRTRQDATYTLVQDLVEVTDCDDSLFLATGASCSALEETTYKWDQSSVEPVPTECEQGVTWSVRAVQRNEDGTYDYQLVKTVARTRHWGPVTIECGPLVTVTEETWESAYGEPGSFEARGCDGDVPVSPVPCDSAPGVRTQVQYKLNPDCTYDVTVRRSESHEFDESWRDGTSCRPQDTTVYRNSRTPPEPPAPRPGERVDFKRQRNEDGSWDATSTVTRAVEPYSYSWTDGSACRPRIVDVYRSQVDRPAVPAVGPGETLDAEVSRNDDCTWDARFAVRKPATEFRTSWREGTPCRPTDVDVVQGAALPPAVPPLSPGKSVQATISRNEDCTYDGRVSVTDVSGAAFDHEWTQGSVCRPESVHVWQRTAAVPPVPSPGEGETVRASISRNEDCTYDGQVTVTRASGPEALSWRSGSPCRPVSHRAWFSQKTPPAFTEPAAGKTVSASLRRNDDCTYDASEEVTESSGATKSWREGSSCRPVDVTAAWGDDDVPPVSPGAAGETVSLDVSRNADCTFDWRRRVVKARASSSDKWTEGNVARTTETTLYSNVAAVVSPGPGGRGVTTQASFRLNDDCTYSGTVSRTTSETGEASWQEGAGCRRVTVRMGWGQSSVPNGSFGDGVTSSVSASRNQDGTFDWTVRTKEPARSAKATLTYGSGDVCTTETVYAFQPNVESPGCGGRGTTTRADARMNEDCTWSGTTSKTVRQSGEASWHEGAGCRRVEVRMGWGQANVPHGATGNGVTSSVSASRNQDGTFDWTMRTKQPAQAAQTVLVYGGGDVCTTETVYAFQARAVSPGCGSPGTTTRADARMNEDCTWSGSSSKTVRQSGEASWTEGAGCRRVTVRMGWGQRSVPSGSTGNGVTSSVSASRNQDGTFDWTMRTKEAARAARATLTYGSGDVCTTETVYAFQPNVESPGCGGAGTTTRADARMNEDCTWSGSMSTTRRNPGSTSWTEGAGCRTVTVQMGWGQGNVPSGQTGSGVTSSVSASRNQDGTFDYVMRTKSAATGASKTLNYGTCGVEDVKAVVYAYQPEPVDPGCGGRGTVTRASAHMNEDCTWSGMTETTTSTPDHKEWNEGGNCRTTEGHVYVNQQDVSIPGAGDGEMVTASVSHNRDGTWNYQYSRTRFTDNDPSPLTWESTEEGPDYTYTYSNWLKVFSHVKSIPTPPDHSAVSVSVTFNDDCTYSGTMSARKLMNWAKSGSGGTTNLDVDTKTFERTIYGIVAGVRMKRVLKYKMTVYVGHPTASQLKEHQQLSSIPGGVVGIDLVNAGMWEKP